MEGSGVKGKTVGKSPHQHLRGPEADPETPRLLQPRGW